MSLISGIAMNFRFPWEKGPLRQLPDDEFQLPGSLEWPNALWDVSTGMQFWIQTRKLAGWKINQGTLMGKIWSEGTEKHMRLVETSWTMLTGFWFF